MLQSTGFSKSFQFSQSKGSLSDTKSSGITGLEKYFQILIHSGN